MLAWHRPDAIASDVRQRTFLDTGQQHCPFGLPHPLREGHRSQLVGTLAADAGRTGADGTARSGRCLPGNGCRSPTQRATLADRP